MTRIRRVLLLFLHGDASPRSATGQLVLVEGEIAMTFHSNPPHWALGYLRGRASAFRRGHLTLNNVGGAVRKALALGARHSEIDQLLARYGLTWDVEHEVLRQS